MKPPRIIFAYLALLLLVPLSPCQADPVSVSQFDISGIRLGMTLAEVEELIAHSKLVEIMREGDPSSRLQLKLYLELDDRHIEVAIKQVNNRAVVRAVLVDYLDPLFAKNGHAQSNRQILDEFTRRLGAPVSSEQSKSGEFNYGLWFDSKFGKDPKFYRPDLADCQVVLMFGRYPKGNARAQLEDLKNL